MTPLSASNDEIVPADRKAQIVTRRCGLSAPGTPLTLRDIRSRSVIGSKADMFGEAREVAE
jgi:hypothetical protein